MMMMMMTTTTINEDCVVGRLLMAGGIFVWSLTTLLGSYAESFSVFITMRALVGVGEASYSTIAPTIISDLTVGDMRSKMLALFYFAIPVGRSAHTRSLDVDPRGPENVVFWKALPSSDGLGHSRNERNAQRIQGPSQSCNNLEFDLNTVLGQNLVSHVFFLFSMKREVDVLVFFYSGLGYIVGSETARALGSWHWGLRVTPVAGAVAVLLILLVSQDPQRGESEGAHLTPTSWLDDIKSLCRK